MTTWYIFLAWCLIGLVRAIGFAGYRLSGTARAIDFCGCLRINTTHLLQLLGLSINRPWVLRVHHIRHQTASRVCRARRLFIETATSGTDCVRSIPTNWLSLQIGSPQSVWVVSTQTSLIGNSYWFDSPRNLFVRTTPTDKSSLRNQFPKQFPLIGTKRRKIFCPDNADWYVREFPKRKCSSNMQYVAIYRPTPLRLTIPIHGHSANSIVSPLEFHCGRPNPVDKTAREINRHKSFKFQTGCLRRTWLGWVSCSLFHTKNQSQLTTNYLLWGKSGQMPLLT